MRVLDHTHFGTELLSEREGIDLSRPTVRRSSHQSGHRQSPQPALTTTPFSAASGCPSLGCWCNWTCSHHAWLEDRGPKFALLLAVDDATGTVESQRRLPHR